MDELQDRRRPLRVLALVVGIAAVVGTLVFSSFRSVQSECSLCVEFRGQRQCRTGLGPSPEEAQEAAQRAACAVMASGMDESIACSRAPRLEMRCQ